MVSIFFIGVDCSSTHWWILVLILLAMISFGIIIQCIMMNRTKYQTENNNKFRIVAIAAKSYVRLSRLVNQSKEPKLIENDIEKIGIENIGIENFI